MTHSELVASIGKLVDEYRGGYINSLTFWDKLVPLVLKRLLETTLFRG